MPCPGINYGIRRLIDANARYFNPGLPIYYRTRKFKNPPPAVSEMGFTIPGLTGDLTGGTNDVQIFPQPTIKQVPMRLIEAAIAAGQALRAGAREIVISHTWVAAMQSLNNYADPKQVFNDPSVVGFVTDNVLMEIVSYTHSDVYGATLDWAIVCNSNEVQ